MSLATHYKRHLGETGNLVDVSAKNKYTPYILDFSGQNPKETLVLLEKVEDNVAHLRKQSNNELLKLPLEIIQLVEGK